MVNGTLRWAAAAVSVVVALGSIAFLISGYSLVTARDRGILSDGSGVAPSEELVADLAWPRILLGAIGILVGAAAVSLTWIPRRSLALSAGAIGVGMIAALIVSGLQWSLGGANTIVLIVMLVGLVVLAVLVGIRLRAPHPAR